MPELCVHVQFENRYTANGVTVILEFDDDEDGGSSLTGDTNGAGCAYFNVERFASGTVHVDGAEVERWSWDDGSVVVTITNYK